MEIKISQGKVIENAAVRRNFIEKNARLTHEKVKSAQSELQQKSKRLAESNQANADVDEFIRKIKRYTKPTELTREMCMELIDRIIVGAEPKSKDELRDIQIAYKVDIDTTI